MENHPEIEAVWLTLDRSVYRKLLQEGKPVCWCRSLKGLWTMCRAKIAVTDHYRVTDYSVFWGFNARTKVVQLWHGVGFKDMERNVQTSSFRKLGLKHSDDIIIHKNDSLSTRIKKRLRFICLAPKRELFEKYFLFVCPGQERIDMIGEKWNINRESYFMAGHPRNLPLYMAERDEAHPKVLYAPTYRDSAAEEKEMVDGCMEALDSIQELMTKINGSFTIRMHPHTWRNYQNRILLKLENYDRIFLDTSKDVYQELGKYSVVISDYSSIALDFAMLDRPVVFYCYDLEWFEKHELGFGLDYLSHTPGPKTRSWRETLEKVYDYVQHPEKDSVFRREVCKYFFTEEVNNIQNSERITEELKRRLRIS